MCAVMKWRIFHKSSIWLTVIVQRCRSFRMSWKQSVPLSLSLSHLYRTEIWVKLSVTCYQQTTEIDTQLLLSVNECEYQLLLSIFISVLSLSLDPQWVWRPSLMHACYLCSLSLPRSSLFPQKFLCIFPSQIAMFYNSEACSPFPDVSLALFRLVRQ